MLLRLIKFNSVKSTNETAIKIIKLKKRKAGIILSKKQTKGMVIFSDFRHGVFNKESIPQYFKKT